ncbi:MAG: DNA-3-methyladenine glycosylase I [Actinomycetales bacterium]
MTDARGLVVGDDGLTRCAWGASTPDYTTYHDTEWGRAVHGESALYERFTLEAFQSGLSWLTILRKREAFRAAFAQFDADVVARYGARERRRLMADTGIVRNGAKIDAAITNAGAVVRLRESGGLDQLVWSHAPTRRRRAPRSFADVVATTPESIALSKALKRNGFVFVGPTTAYAAMQACGLVNDHLAGCHARSAAGSA